MHFAFLWIEKRPTRSFASTLERRGKSEAVDFSVAMDWSSCVLRVSAWLSVMVNRVERQTNEVQVARLEVQESKADKYETGFDMNQITAIQMNLFEGGLPLTWLTERDGVRQRRISRKGGKLLIDQVLVLAGIQAEGASGSISLSGPLY